MENVVPAYAKPLWHSLSLNRILDSESQSPTIFADLNAFITHLLKQKETTPSLYSRSALQPPEYKPERIILKLLLEQKNIVINGKKLTQIKFVDNIENNTEFTAYQIKKFTLKLFFLDGSTEQIYFDSRDFTKFFAQKYTKFIREFPVSDIRHQITPKDYNLVLAFFYNLAKNLDSQSFEIDLSKYQNLEVFPDYYWVMGWDSETEISTIYELIHKNILTAFDIISSDLPENADIVDCGCGQGLLLRELCYEYRKTKYNFFGIERDEMLCRNTKNFFSALLNLKKIIPGDLADLDTILEKNLIRAGCLIFSGILTKQVLASKAQAKLILEKARKVLIPGGYIIIDGLSHNLLRRKDFEALGFRVLHTFAFESGRPLFVLQLS